jgi:hypothetical protein
MVILVHATLSIILNKNNFIRYSSLTVFNKISIISTIKKKKYILTLIALLYALNIGPGCVWGVNTKLNRKSNIQYPNISKEIKRIGYKGLSQSNAITKEELANYWGAPDNKKTNNKDSEFYRYNYGLRWNGILITFFGIPIPLAIPVGHKYLEFNILDNTLISASMVDDYGGGGYMCGFIPKWIMGCGFIKTGPLNNDNVVLGTFGEDWRLLRQ